MDKNRNKRFALIVLLAAVAVIAIVVSGAAPDVSEDKNVESSADEIAMTSDVPSSINYRRAVEWDVQHDFPAV
jgi:Tfp pilus assembly protein FimT